MPTLPPDVCCLQNSTSLPPWSAARTVYLALKTTARVADSSFRDALNKDAPPHINKSARRIAPAAKNNVGTEETLLSHPSYRFTAGGLPVSIHHREATKSVPSNSLSSVHVINPVNLSRQTVYAYKNKIHQDVINNGTNTSLLNFPSV